MTKKFYAVHRETGERWKPRKDVHEYLVMYDSGYLAVVTAWGGWESDSIQPLDNKIWKKVMKDES